MPLRLRLLQGAVDSSTPVDIGPIVQELLGGDLTPAMRSWVLLVKGEVDRAQGNRDEARTQFELARTTGAGTPMAAQAGFRLARTNFELREYPQALSDLAPLASAPLPADLRIAVLILQGEAAYQAGDHATAGGAFRRVLLEFPDAPQTPLVRLAVAWTSLRQGRAETARREFLDFVRAAPDSPYAVDALVLAAELATEAGDLEAAGELLDQVVQKYPQHPRTDFARLNRGILLVRTGNTAAAQTALRDWLGRASFPALFGRAHVALGAALLDSGDTFGAQREFTLAQRDGMGPFASLGLGAIAMNRGRWDEASKSFTEARDSGTPAVAAAAEYGLAAIAYAKDGGRDFKKPALAALAALPPGGRNASQGGTLLYVAHRDLRGGEELAGRARLRAPPRRPVPDARSRRRWARARGGRRGGVSRLARRPQRRPAPARALSAEPVRRGGARAGGRGAARDRQGGRGQVARSTRCWRRRRTTREPLCCSRGCARPAAIAAVRSRPTRARRARGRACRPTGRALLGHGRLLVEDRAVEPGPWRVRGAAQERGHGDRGRGRARYRRLVRR